MNKGLTWMPGIFMSVGVILTIGVGGQRSLPLRAPLADAIPDTLLELPGRDIVLSDAELQVSGISSYLLRDFMADSALGFSVYVGYYEQQQRGRTIHSPRNCLPGTGWEPLASTTIPVVLGHGDSVTVNRYTIQNDQDKAIVLYWYQGRGRIAHNEYLVKWDLLRDAALRHRSDEALVRIVVPVTSTEEDAVALATTAAQALIPAIDSALPE